MVERRTPEREVGGSGRRVVSFSKTYLLPKSIGNTLKAMAPSRHDEIYYPTTSRTGTVYIVTSCFCRMGLQVTVKITDAEIFELYKS